MSAGTQTRRWLIGAALIALGALSALLLQRQLAPRSAPAAAAGAAEQSAPSGTSYAPFTLRAPRPAFSAEEEAYAAGLWPIHSAVKDAAVQMTFAGLAFKLKEADAAAFRQKLQPLQTVFTDIAQKLAQLEAPAAFAEHHRNYAAALDLYRASVAQMLKAADDGAEQHLLGAQEKSYQAGQLLLKVGNTLWPTEYKPN